VYVGHEISTSEEFRRYLDSLFKMFVAADVGFDLVNKGSILKVRFQSGIVDGGVGSLPFLS
jgi:hypothetical protein